MFHAVKTHRSGQSAAGSGNGLQRLGGSTPAALPTAAIVPLRPGVEEREGFPLQMECILPEQFFGRARSHESGERRLLAAVLDDAIACFQRFLFPAGQRQRRLYQEAEQWIMERTRASADACPNFSFDRVCDVLGLDADGVRDRLMLWRDAQLATARVIDTSVAGRRWREPSSPAVRVGHGKLQRWRAA